MNEWLFSRHGRGGAFVGACRPPSTGTTTQEGQPMTRSLSRSNAHFRKAITRLPLGVSSNFRYWGEDKTIYAPARQGRPPARHRRQRIHRLPHGLRPLHPRLRRPARRRGRPQRASRSAAYSRSSTEREYAVAERISRMVPAAELVRFSNSGTEAVMAALRLARAYTGTRFLRRRRRRLPRRIRCRTVVHADRGLAALLRRSASGALQRRRAGHPARPCSMRCR